ncbi:MAG: hypothetical protein LVO36_02750 [Nitrosopumilus sp. (ex Thoosa mismalolli)]|nr:hypothetical protein [Nitrosopumilus sp. (ex Thoosa mismalolli)]
MPHVKRLIDEEFPDKTNIIEPFPYNAKTDVFDYLTGIPNGSADGALVDPPYTQYQKLQHYKQNNIKVESWMTSSKWTSYVKREIAKKLKIGAKAITFGYNSSGLYKKMEWKFTGF